MANRCWKNAEGKKTTRKALLWETKGTGKSSDTLKRSGRLREDCLEDLFLIGTEQSKSLKDRPFGKDHRGSEETDKVASFVW